MSILGVARFAVLFVVMVVVTAVTGEFLARLGSGVLGFVRRDGDAPGRAGRDLERFGVSFLLGWPVLGAACLGLALAGLFSPPVLVAAGLGLAAASRGMWEKRSLVLSAAREARLFGWLGGSVVLGLLPAFANLTVREGGLDAWMLHLGAAWQYLQAGRAVLEQCRFSFHFPLVVEMGFALPVALGEDRLAKAIVVLCFLSVAAVAGGRALREGSRVSGWLGSLLILSSTQMLFLVSISKQDVPASSLFVAGAVLQMSGAWIAGAALLGWCVASKIMFGPLVAAWGLLFVPLLKSRGLRPQAGNLAWGRLGCWLALIVLPVLPWWAKSWLATGNPVYPVADGMFPSLNWGAANWEAFRLYMDTQIPGGRVGVLGLPRVWLVRMTEDHLLAALLLPALLFLSRRRLAAAACVAGQLVVFGATQLSRYLLPGAWLICLLAADEVGRLRPRLRGAVTALLVGYSLLSVGLSPPAAPGAWAALMRYEEHKEFLKRSTFEEARRLLIKHGVGGVPWVPGRARPGRVLSIGEWRTYRFPGRLLVNGVFGETPLVWRLATSSRDVEELGKRVRQMGARRLLFNYVSVDWMSLRYDPFPWDRRSLRLYVDFCKRHLKVLGRTERCDFINGGFYVYEVLPRARPDPPATVWFAPGTELVYGKGIRLENTRQLPEALAAYQEALDLLPDVGHAWNLVGHAYTLLNNSPRAYEYLRRFSETGMMDSMNLGEYGAVAVRMGELDLAERVLWDAYDRYPNHRHTVEINQAFWYGQKSIQALGKRDFAASAKFVERGFAIINGVRADLDEANSKARRAALAFLTGMQGELHLVRGAGGPAAKCFLEAAELDPDAPMVTRWRGLAEQLQPRMFR